VPADFADGISAAIRCCNSAWSDSRLRKYPGYVALVIPSPLRAVDVQLDDHFDPFSGRRRASARLRAGKRAADNERRKKKQTPLQG
jgi:hypothetical protein